MTTAASPGSALMRSAAALPACLTVARVAASEVAHDGGEAGAGESPGQVDGRWRAYDRRPAAGPAQDAETDAEPGGDGPGDRVNGRGRIGQ